MKSALLCLAFAAFASTAALAQQEYNTVPNGDPQYQQCLGLAKKNYTGGEDRSPIRGQSKAQAWCTCLWNETPDDFKGNLVRFSESRKGKEVAKACEKYADWS